MQQSVVQIENVSIELSAITAVIPTVTTQVEEFTRSMNRLKQSSTETFITMEDKFGNIITMSQKAELHEESESTARTVKAIEEVTAPATSVLVPYAPPAMPPPLPPSPPPISEEENKMTIGEAIKGLPEELGNLRTQYDNMVNSAATFGNMAKNAADKLFIQSGAAKLLLENVPLLGDVYRSVQGPIQSVMEKVGGVGSVIGGFADNFHEGVDFVTELTGSIRDAYNVAEGGLESFNSYINSVKEIDTMVRTLTDAQKWAAFFTNIYTAAQSALNVVMNLSPWTIVIGLVLAFVAALKLAWDKSESFRKVLFGVWEVAKVVFKGLFEIGKYVFDAYITMWTGIAQVILGALKAPFDGGKMFNEGLDSIAKSTDMLTTIPDKMNKLGEDVGKAWAQGQEKGSESFRKSQEDKKKFKQTAVPADQIVNYGNITGVPTPPSILGTGTMGGNSKTINVRIESLVKEMNIHTEMKNGAQEIRNLIKEELIAAVRDFELSVSNG